MSSSPADFEMCKPRFPAISEAADTGSGEHTAQLVFVDKHTVLVVAQQRLVRAGKRTQQPDSDQLLRTS